MCIYIYLTLQKNMLLEKYKRLIYYILFILYYIILYLYYIFLLVLIKK